MRFRRPRSRSAWVRGSPSWLPTPVLQRPNGWPWHFHTSRSFFSTARSSASFFWLGNLLSAGMWHAATAAAAVTNRSVWRTSRRSGPTQTRVPEVQDKRNPPKSASGARRGGDEGNPSAHRIGLPFQRLSTKTRVDTDRKLVMLLLGNKVEQPHRTRWCYY